MSNPTDSMTDDEWLGANDLRPATIKGNPSKTHLLPKGAWAALCGKEPGKSNSYSMRARSGWYVYAKMDGRGRPLCEACAAKVPTQPKDA